MSRCLPVVTFLVGLLLLGQPASAQSATYHLERLQIQARVFLDTLQPVQAPGTQTSASVSEQLELSSSNSVWSQQMVTEDVKKIVETSRQLTSVLAQPTPDQLLAARSSLEALSRRLRVSSSALTLGPQSRTALDFLMLELEESTQAMNADRDILVAQAKNQRSRRSRWGASIGIGYGGLGGWGSPFGWGSYYPYGNGFGPGPFYSGGFPYVGGFGPGGCGF